VEESKGKILSKMADTCQNPTLTTLTTLKCSHTVPTPTGSEASD